MDSVYACIAPALLQAVMPPYTPGQAGIVMYSTEEDIAERVPVFFYKRRKNNQSWRGVNVPATEGATETALEGLLE